MVRITYKILMMLLSFFLVIFIPFALLLYYDTGKLMDGMDQLQPLTPEQRVLYTQAIKGLDDNMIFMAFYMFVVAFVLALFYARSLMEPVMALLRGAEAFKSGQRVPRLDVLSNDELGNVVRAFNAMSERIATMEQDLSRKNQYLSAMLDPMMVLDTDNMVVDVNPAFLGLFGYAQQEMPGAMLFDFLDEAGERAVRRLVHDASPLAQSNAEVSFISKTQGLVPVRLSISAVKEQGETVARIVTVRDYRAEKALRAALQEEKESAEIVMENMVDQLLVVDRNGKVLRANRAANLAAGREVKGESCHMLLHAPGDACEAEGMDCPINQVQRTGLSFRTVHEHLLSNGQCQHHEVIAFPIKGPTDEVKNIVLTLRDTTEHVRSVGQMHQKARELQAVNEVARLLGHSLKSDEIFNVVLASVIENFEMDGGGVFFMDEYGKSLMFRYQRGLSEEYFRSIERVPVGQDLPGRVAQSGEAFFTSDITRDPRAEGFPMMHAGPKSFACLPIRGKEKLLGVFMLFSFRTRNFSEEDGRVLGSICEMIGMSLENILLYERLRELYDTNRARRTEDLQNMFELSSQLASLADLQRVLEASLGLLRKATRADFIWIMRHEDAAKGLFLEAATAGEPAPDVAIYGPSVPSVERLAIEERRMVTVFPLTTDMRYAKDSRITKFQTCHSIPVLVGDRVLGALSIYYLIRKELREEEAHFLQTAASLFAVAMERTRLHESVAVQRGMAETVLRGITDGVITVLPDGSLDDMNVAASTMLGVQMQEGINLSLDALLLRAIKEPETRLRIQGAFEDALKGNRQAIDLNLWMTDGRHLPAVVHCTPVLDKKGQIAAVVFVIRDLSREMEINSMKADFLRGVSHEFRTPLTALIGMTEMLIEGDVQGPRVQEYLSTILYEAEHLSDMVSDVLDLAKIDRGKEVYLESDVDFAAIARKLHDNLEPELLKKKISFDYSVSPDAKGFRGDGERLKQMLGNLLDNAVTYSDACSAVSLTVKREADGLVLQVIDKGWGMSDEDLEHVGERFFRGKGTTKTRGTGLGLSLCSEIAQMHGGSLKVTSRKAQGTTVTVTLPARRH